jgi:hypothetical protein
MAGDDGGDWSIRCGKLRCSRRRGRLRPVDRGAGGDKACEEEGEEAGKGHGVIIRPCRVHLKVHRLAAITNLRAYTHMVHLEVHPTLRNLSGASLPRLQLGHV